MKWVVAPKKKAFSPSLPKWRSIGCNTKRPLLSNAVSKIEDATTPALSRSNSPPRWIAAVGFVVAGFPRLVRAQRGYLAAAAVLFFAPLISIGLLLQWRPELVHTLFNAELLAQFESMYDPAAGHHALGRESGSDLQMFGHYVMNNISIGFRSFASGLVGALGPIGIFVGPIAVAFLQAALTMLQAEIDSLSEQGAAGRGETGPNASRRSRRRRGGGQPPPTGLAEPGGGRVES